MTANNVFYSNISFRLRASDYSDVPEAHTHIQSKFHIEDLSSYAPKKLRKCTLSN